MALSTALLASCSSTSDPIQRLGLNPQSPEVLAAPQATTADLPAGQQGYFIIAEDDPVLPDQVSQVPQLQSGESPVVVAAATPAMVETTPAAAAQAPSSPAPAAQTPPAPQEMAQASQTSAAEQSQPAAAEQPSAENAFAAPAKAAPTQKRGLFASLFSRPAAAEQQAPREAAALAQRAAAAQNAVETTGATTQPSAQQPQGNTAQADSGEKREFLNGMYSESGTQGAAKRPPLQFASIASAGQPARQMYNSDALPGVRRGALFEINRRDGAAGSDADIDLYEEDTGVQLASAAGLARLAPNGLLKQTESVDVACLKPSLVRTLKTIESRYGKKMVVTSGYRSPPRNRAARGASNSLHMYCAAADVQVPGVDKWELAQFIRDMPGRGGVGTYCHTNSVHIDVGPERDWNWRCRRRR